MSFATSLPRGRIRGEWPARVAARARPRERRARAWINGRELGGADPRFAHLTASHD